MIGVILRFGSEIVEIRIKDNNCFFRTSNSTQFGDIEGIKLEKQGVLKEHPDLENREDWKQETRKRFKEHLKKIKTEEEQVKYVIKDLQKFGYKPMYIQKQGFRPVKI